MSGAIGKKRAKVTIQRPVGQDGAGDTSGAWQDVLCGWRARSEPLSGRELVQNQQREGQVLTRFTMRFKRGVTPAMRLLWKLAGETKQFNITAVLVKEGLQREMVIMAEELVGRDP